jgi:hypothetical protein
MATDPDIDPNKSQDNMPTTSNQLTTTLVSTALYNNITSPFDNPWDLSQKAANQV